MLLPLVAQQTLHGSAQTFGLIAAVFGAGALLGATANATRGHASLRVLLLGALGYGIFELVLAPLDSLVPVCVVLFLIGFCYTQWGTTALATIQLEAPERLRGRAASLYFFAFLGGAPLGGLFAGWLVEVGGTAARVLRRGSGGGADRAGLRGDAQDDLAGPADLVVADQPVSHEPDAAVELQREHAA